MSGWDGLSCPSHPSNFNIHGESNFRARSKATDRSVRPSHTGIATHATMAGPSGFVRPK
ncbi:MAG: hypothetical protein QOF56_174 [Acidobacteriaceae bacterium]|nr:hypothetical protein [Acidobacteriaceae bacterium]